MAAQDKTNPSLLKDHQSEAAFDNVLPIFKHKNFKPATQQPISKQVIEQGTDLNSTLEEKNHIEVSTYTPREFTSLKRSTAVSNSKSSHSFQDLKDNLSELKGLHQKLKFMLKELEDLVSKP